MDSPRCNAQSVLKAHRVLKMVYLEGCHLQGLSAESENDNSKCPAVGTGTDACVKSWAGNSTPLGMS